MKTIDEMHRKLKSDLNDKRYAHSVRVAELARSLAARYNANADKAYIAGLLHDCAKQMDALSILQTAAEAGVTIDEIQLQQPTAMLHAEVGAYIAERDYGVVDAEILQAIRYHQSGGTDMTAFDKIICLADSTEPNRTSPGIAEVRRILKADLDEAFFTGFVNGMMNVIKGGSFLDINKSNVYNRLLLDKKKNASIKMGMRER